MLLNRTRRSPTTHSDDRLDSFVMFGGIELMVPENWKVHVGGMPIFGGWSNKARLREDAPADLPMLHVRCFVAFGGIEVHN
jgi:hypothetical protein